ncbi:transporter substrate-binding domain-containing protein [Clostridium sp. CS001]|uniref:HD domain-containing phosphohydrolase n=1 Tax=Clostridium sp. CS001 TaxID=2880648 RepID=UPI001CF3A988|nr:transporter substrate-binding domain-containing protein [Clostridium sp. CS001]MCB2288665.1 transporter substrate-binding domain-containing protein [Clostridium sp. CS001]
MFSIKGRSFVIVFIAILIISLGNSYINTAFADNKVSESSNKDPSYKEKYMDQKPLGRTIIIGDDKDYPPYSFIDEKGNPAGFNVELAKAAAKAMGINVIIKLGEWSEIKEELENGTIDAISGMFYSEEREKIYSFTTKHTITSGDVFTRKDTIIKDIRELKGKTVVVQTGDIVGEFLKKQNLNINFIEVPTVDEALSLVSIKKYDYAAVLKITGHYLIKKEKYSNIKSNEFGINPNGYCFAVKEGNNDLLFTLNGGLQILKATGEFDKIYNKWLGVYESRTLFQVLIDYIWLIAIVIVTILLLILWTSTLKIKVDSRTRELLKLNDALKESQEELIASNEEIEASFNELSAAEEELRTQFQQLIESEDNLKKSEERNKAIVAAIPDVIFIVDGNGVFKDCQTNDDSILIMPKHEFIGKTLWEVLPPKIAETGFEKIKLALKNNSLESFEYDIDTPVGTKYFELRIVRCRKNEIIAISRDVTLKYISERELEFLSYHDQLTGLYNRRFFEEELKRLDNKENLPLTIFMADVNGLKLVNDSFGHATGDELLKRIAMVILKGCGDNGTVSRIGGDEFVILLPKVDTIKAEEIFKCISALASEEEVSSIKLSVSIGYETKYNDGEDIFGVLKKAEDFMYKKKLFESPSMRGKTIGAIINTLYEKNKREEQHSHRVSEYCSYLGKAMKLPDGEVQELKTAGLLHDIGKIAIDDNILNKPGKLSEAEWEELRRHPEISYRILSSVNDMSEIADYVLSHHERWDGNGYPKGLKGTEIPIKSRIIGVVDAYDAITSERSYRGALSKEFAIEELIKNSGTQFDAEIVKIFIEKVIKGNEKKHKQ